MDDAPPPQDPNPSMMNDYDGGAGKDPESSMPSDDVSGDAVPRDDAGGGGLSGGLDDNDDPSSENAAVASTEAAAAAASSSGGGRDSAMEGGEEGALPSGGGGGVPGTGGVGGGGGGGNLYLRPIFLGNLHHNCMASDIENVFTSTAPPGGGGMGNDGEVKPPCSLDRVDMKRGYAFVFLKDPENHAEKERAENFVQEINGMNVPQVSNALRAEFARGDGRVKRKEDERRKKIVPNETLFVVNFHEETTKREDLQMLFEPYGELVRIDMKRNYAFVQFKSVDEAIRAKDATNGGKLDQSEITVEFVARRMGEPGRGDGRDSRSRSRSRSPGYRRRSRSRSPGYEREYRSSRDDYRPSSRGGRDSYEDRERVERGYGRSEY